MYHTLCQTLQQDDGAGDPIELDRLLDETGALGARSEPDDRRAVPTLALPGARDLAHERVR